jgi:hypothetical protein
MTRHSWIENAFNMMLVSTQCRSKRFSNVAILVTQVEAGVHWGLIPLQSAS